jgi:hypothetical protein
MMLVQTVATPTTASLLVTEPLGFQMKSESVLASTR